MKSILCRLINRLVIVSILLGLFPLSCLAVACPDLVDSSENAVSGILRCPDNAHERNFKHTLSELGIKVGSTWRAVQCEGVYYRGGCVANFGINNETYYNNTVELENRINNKNPGCSVVQMIVPCQIEYGPSDPNAGKSNGNKTLFKVNGVWVQPR